MSTCSLLLFLFLGGPKQNYCFLEKGPPPPACSSKFKVALYTNGKAVCCDDRNEQIFSCTEAAELMFRWLKNLSSIWKTVQNQMTADHFVRWTSIITGKWMIASLFSLCVPAELAPAALHLSQTNTSPHRFTVFLPNPVDNVQVWIVFLLLIFVRLNCLWFCQCLLASWLPLLLFMFCGCATFSFCWRFYGWFVWAPKCFSPVERINGV